MADAAQNSGMKLQRSRAGFSIADILTSQPRIDDVSMRASTGVRVQGVTYLPMSGRAHSVDFRIRRIVAGSSQSTGKHKPANLLFCC